MLLMSLLRLSGIVILLVFLMVTIVVGVNRGVLAGILPGMIVLLGLWMAFAGDKGMARRKTEKEQAQKREAEAFRDVSLTAGLRWFRWLLWVILLAGLAYFSVFIGVVETWGAGKYVPFAVMFFLGLLMVTGLTGLLVLGWQVVRAGQFLHLEYSGFAHAALPVIPWRDVQGVDLKEEEIKGVKNWYLVLALSRDAWERLRSAGWRRFVYWMAPRVDAQRPILSVHCNWTSVPAATLLEATKRIADSAGAPRIKSWHQYESIEVAMRREALGNEAQWADEQVTQLLLKLQRLSKSSAVSADEVKLLDAQIQQAMNEASRARETQFSNIKTSMESSLNKYKRSLRGLSLGLGVVAVVIAVQIVYAWMK